MQFMTNNLSHLNAWIKAYLQFKWLCQPGGEWLSICFICRDGRQTMITQLFGTCIIFLNSDNSLVLFYFVDLHISNAAMSMTKYVQILQKTKTTTIYNLPKSNFNHGTFHLVQTLDIFRHQQQLSGTASGQMKPQHYRFIFSLSNAIIFL